jgi:DnaK suppressor protein
MLRKASLPPAKRASVSAKKAVPTARAKPIAAPKAAPVRKVTKVTVPTKKATIKRAPANAVASSKTTPRSGAKSALRPEKARAKATVQKKIAPKALAPRKAAPKPAPKKAVSAKSLPSKTSSTKAAVAKPSAAKKVAPKVQKRRAAALRTAPKRPEGYSNDERFIAHQRAALEGERATYMEQATNLKEEAEALVEEMEPGDIQFDEESGEGGTVTVDRERDLALSAQALAAVEEIDDALARIKAGHYGACESCGGLIPKARLEALPYARLCIACKSGGLSRR